MRLPIHSYEKINDAPPMLLELPKNFGFSENIRKQDRDEIIPDINELSEYDPMYLIRQHVENLREEIGLSLDGIIELQELEAIIKEYEDDLAAIPNNLGVPGKTDQFIAALEAKRVNRIDDALYDGGDIDDEYLSGIDQHYQKLFKESWLNVKSLKILSSPNTPPGDNKKMLSLFDLYDRESFHKVFRRCQEIAVSPIYDDMETLGDEHYRLQYGCEMRFTDKTAIFTIPIEQFFDIPRADNKAAIAEPAFIQVSFVLPEYAHERKRFFRKGGSVKEFSAYLERLAVVLSERQRQFLDILVEHGSLRLYREVLELPDRDEIRGYLFNVRSGYERYSKGQIFKHLRKRLDEYGNLNIKTVTHLHTRYPEWMRKIGGFIVEEINGNAVSLPRPLRIAVDKQLPRYSFRQERLLIPSDRLISTNNMSRESWQNLYIAELRGAYHRNPLKFKEYAEKLDAREMQLHCSCNNNGTHGKYCPVPVLREVFGKIVGGNGRKKTL